MSHRRKCYAESVCSCSLPLRLGSLLLENSPGKAFASSLDWLIKWSSLGFSLRHCVQETRYWFDSYFTNVISKILNGEVISCLSSVQFSCSVMPDSLRPHELQHARPPCPSPTPGVHWNTSIVLVMPSSHLILCHPLLLLPSIFPSIRVWIFKWVNSSHQVAKGLEFQLQHQSFQWTFRTDFL